MYVMMYVNDAAFHIDVTGINAYTCGVKTFFVFQFFIIVPGPPDATEKRFVIFIDQKPKIYCRLLNASN